MILKQNKKDSNSHVLLPVRYILESEELSSCFSVLGKFPLESPLFASLPKPCLELPKRVLNDQGDLSPEATKLFQILADPVFIANIENIAANCRYGVQTMLFSGSTTDFYVLLSQELSGSWDLVLLTDIDQVLSLVNDLTGLSQAKDSLGNFSKTIPIPGLAALAAFSDLVRHSQIKSELERSSLSVDYLISPIIAEDLAQVIEKTDEQPDMRSAVSKLSYLSEGAISRIQSADALKMGIQQLYDTGLVDEDGSISEDGFALAIGLTQALSISSIAATNLGQSTLYVDRFVFIFFPDAILAGAWQLDDDGKFSSLTISETCSDSVLSNIKKIIEHRYMDRNKSKTEVKPKEKFDTANVTTKKKCCRSCGERLKPGAKFCTNCGAQL